jgi:hypothetical protein
MYRTALLECWNAFGEEVGTVGALEQVARHCPLVRRGSFNNIPTRFLLRKCAIVQNGQLLSTCNFCPTKYSLASSQTHTAQHLLFSHMIIPIKCFTCGNVLADKFRYFQEKVRQRKIKDDKALDAVIYLTKEIRSL